MDLAARHCQPLPAGTPALTTEETQALAGQVDGWAVEGAGADARLRKTYRFANFANALAFVNRVGALADAEDHHPDVHLGWGRAGIELWTHSVGGLSENDFILAAQIEQAFRAFEAACDPPQR